MEKVTRKYYSDVVVCDRWNPRSGGSFENFVEDMGERPEGMTLNRVNGARYILRKIANGLHTQSKTTMFVERRTNKSGRSGVKWRDDRQVWEARITKNGKITILYYGSSFEEACKAREKAELELYGFTKE